MQSNEIFLFKASKYSRVMARHYLYTVQLLRFVEKMILIQEKYSKLSSTVNSNT